jgi:hypothetical protein
MASGRPIEFLPYPRLEPLQNKRRKIGHEKSSSALSCDIFRIRPDGFGG